MTTFALTDATIMINGHDFSADSNQVSLAAEADALDSTSFRSRRWRSRVGGLKTTTLDLSGFWDPVPDAGIFSDIQTGQRNRPVTVSPTNAEGDVAYMFRAGFFSYEQGDEVGALAPFSLGVQNTSGEGLIRGRYLKRATDDDGDAVNVTANGATGTAYQLGAVGTGQFLYATFHVLTAGTTITAVVESDDNASFTTATTRITIGPITTAGGTWGTRLIGPVTDTYYRLRVTAITGTFNIAAAVGIG